MLCRYTHSRSEGIIPCESVEGAGNEGECRNLQFLKVEAVRAIFAVAFPEDNIQVNAINVPSGVPAQRVMSIRRLTPFKSFLRFFLDITGMDS